MKDERDCAVIGSSADACLKDVKRKIMTLYVNDTERIQSSFVAER